MAATTVTVRQTQLFIQILSTQEIPAAEAVVRQLLTIQTVKDLQLLVQILAEINIKILKFIAEEEPALKLEGTLL